MERTSSPESSSAELPPPKPSRLERLLAIFTDVRAGEGLTALALTCNVFALLTAYYIIKPVREALILALESGAEYKAYMSAAIACLLLIAVPLYARLADRMQKLRLVTGATLFFASNLLLFWLLAKLPGSKAQIGLIFYCWVGVFNMMVVAQFWAYANDLYDEERGRRLFPLIALGASLGAALGAKFAAILIPVLGVQSMLLVSAVLLVVCAALFVVAERGRPRQESSTQRPTAKTEPRSRSGAFALVAKHRYLSLLAGFSLLFTWINSNGEYMLARLVKQSAERAVIEGRLESAEIGSFIGAFYGDFFFWVNVIGVLLQSFVVSRVVKHLGMGVAFFIFPVVALGSALAAALLPILAVLRIGKVLENGTDYSFNNTVRQMLWLPTTQDMKYKAKQAVDSFFVRMGDVSSALLVYLGTTLAGFDVRGFAISNLILVAVWLVLAVAIIKDNARLRTVQVQAVGARV